ncbi:MAG: metallophosphoesterase [Planctomycetes bacterium]|nr:metallophosphoesterase [Planctomycetota bacterium]
MPDPDRLLTTLHRATQACRDTPGRLGRTVRLEDAAEVLATGDLHGNLENFRRLLLRADLDGNPRRHLVLQELIHGSLHYTAGSDKSHQLLDVVAALKCQYPRQVHLLPGNHELAQFTDRRIDKNDQELNEQFRKGVEHAYRTIGS